MEIRKGENKDRKYGETQMEKKTQTFKKIQPQKNKKEKQNRRTSPSKDALEMFIKRKLNGDVRQADHRWREATVEATRSVHRQHRRECRQKCPIPSIALLRLNDNCQSLIPPRQGSDHHPRSNEPKRIRHDVGDGARQDGREHLAGNF